MKIKTKRRMYLREATVTLLLARLAMRFVSPARLFGWAKRPPRRVARFAGDEAAWVAWAIDQRGANAASLARALAAHAMLRRRGIASRLCLGIARDGRELATQAWVEAGTSVIGHQAGFVRLAQSGGGR